MPQEMKTFTVPTTGKMDEIGPVEGMSLRDWFAGQALAGGCPMPTLGRPDDALPIAKSAYAMADAMLEARKG